MGRNAFKKEGKNGLRSVVAMSAYRSDKTRETVDEGMDDDAPADEA